MAKVDRRPCVDALAIASCSSPCLEARRAVQIGDPEPCPSPSPSPAAPRHAWARGARASVQRRRSSIPAPSPPCWATGTLPSSPPSSRLVRSSPLVSLLAEVHTTLLEPMLRINCLRDDEPTCFNCSQHDSSSPAR